MLLKAVSGPFLHHLEVHMIEDLAHSCMKRVDTQLWDALKLLMRYEALRTECLVDTDAWTIGQVDKSLKLWLMLLVLYLPFCHDPGP